MFDLIVYHRIPPLRQARYCCHSLKLVHGNNRIKVTGVRRFESHYNWIDRSYNWKSKLYATNGDSLFPPNI